MHMSELYQLLADDQKAAAAKIQMESSAQIEKCSSVEEVAKFVTYVLERVRQQGINKILGMQGQYVEIVTEPEKEKKENAVETPEPN